MKKTVGRKSVQSKRTSCKKKRSLKVKGGRKNYKKKARVTNKKKGGMDNDPDAMDVDDAMDYAEQSAIRNYPQAQELYASVGLPAPTQDIGQVRQSARESFTRRQQVASQNECPICFETMTEGDSTVTQCNHRFHNACLTQLCDSVKRRATPTCPTCRKNITWNCIQLDKQRGIAAYPIHTGTERQEKYDTESRNHNSGVNPRIYFDIYSDPYW